VIKKGGLDAMSVLTRAVIVSAATSFLVFAVPPQLKAG
jgi:hypothetical protein